MNKSLVGLDGKTTREFTFLGELSL